VKHLFINGVPALRDGKKTGINAGKRVPRQEACHE